MGLVVLLALQLRLVDVRPVQHVDRLVVLQLVVARHAPMVLVRLGMVVVHAPADPRPVAACAVAVVVRQLEVPLRLAAQHARLAILDRLLLIGGQLHAEGVEVLLKLREEALRDLVHLRLLGVVLRRVVERQLDVVGKVGQALVHATVQPLLDRAEVHGVLDDVMVVGQPERIRVHGHVEDPSVSVIHQLLQQRHGVLLDLRALQLQDHLQALHVILDILRGQRVQDARAIRNALPGGSLPLSPTRVRPRSFVGEGPSVDGMHAPRGATRAGHRSGPGSRVRI
mmetsp:Transcript_1639/g.7166  ORF Transcript_1639/g.7166 Transcript_1639/m.7166 type:complete len:283 (-) Transcript_1639:1944-2792(-)|eukprot:scaffold6358_cov267-Pinguiococcus_pyrenoidosus.AAC.8